MKLFECIRRTLMLSLMMFATLLGPTPTSMAGVVMNLATGFDNATGKLLADGVTDSKYVIAPGSTGGSIGENPTVQTNPLPPTYLSDAASTGSRWDVIRLGAGVEGIVVPGGTFIFRTHVTLTDEESPTARIAGLRYAADNSLIGVTINDTKVFSQNLALREEFEAFHELPDFGLGLMHTGLNTIDFTVYNYEIWDSPMAFRLEGFVVSSTVPEPSSLILCGLGGVAAIAYGRRRRSKHCVG